MLKNLISQGNFAIWAQSAMVLFFVIFLGILIWVFRKRSSNHYRAMARLAVDDQTFKRGGE